MEASDASLRAFAADAVAAALLASAAIDRCAAADEPVRETLASTFPDAVPEAMKSEDHRGRNPRGRSRGSTPRGRTSSSASAAS